MDWPGSGEGKFRTFVKTVMKCRELREHLSKHQFYKNDFCIELFGWVISQSVSQSVSHNMHVVVRNP
jgi:hypothetical protein